MLTVVVILYIREIVKNFSKMNNFNNKTYLITGANSGMGKCVTEMLIRAGAVVFMIDKKTENISRIATEVSNGSTFMEFDLNNPSRIDEIFDVAKSKGIHFDGMVYCAGISPLMSLQEFSLETLQLTFNINLISFVAMLSHFTDSEVTNEYASIVGISSNAASIGGNRQYGYSATKAAMNLVVKSSVKELAQRKIRVNTVMPSTTNTEMVAELRKKSDAIDLNVKYKQPFGIIEPENVAKTVLFLLSDDSLSLSGVCIPVNNGEIY